MYFKKQKKANAILDSIMILIMLFAMGVCLVYIYSALNPVYEDLYISFNETGNNWSRDFIQEQDENYPIFWDAAIVFIFLGMWLTGLIAGYLLDTYPIFFLIVIIIIVPILFVGITLSNVYDDLMLEDDIIEYKSQFPMSYWIITHFLSIAIIVILSISGVIYAKNKLT